MKSCIATFHLRSKAMSYTSDDGDNMKTCKDYLNEMVSNDDIFIQANQSCLAHTLSGACKRAVIDAQTGTLSIEQTRINCRSQKWCNFFGEAQKICHPPLKNL
jgi:hypothetical protein